MSLSSRAVAVAAATGCSRLGNAARHGWSDTSCAKVTGVVAIAPRLAFVEGQKFEQRVLGRTSEDDPALRELIGVTGDVVRIEDSTATPALLAVSDAALADPDVSVVLQAVLPGLYGGYHRPDLMIRTPRGWAIGEVKVYLDAGGDTSPHLVQSTAMQAAVSVVAGRHHGLTVDDEALIILASSQGKPSLRSLNLAGEVELVTALLHTNPPPSRDAIEMPDLTQHRYNPSLCEGSCALAETCRREAGSAPGIFWPGDQTAPTYGWTHEDLLAQCERGVAPAAVQAGWDAGRQSVARA